MALFSIKILNKHVPGCQFPSDTHSVIDSGRYFIMDEKKRIQLLAGCSIIADTHSKVEQVQSTRG